MVLHVFTEKLVLIRISIGFSRSDKLIVIHQPCKFKPFMSKSMQKTQKRTPEMEPFFTYALFFRRMPYRIIAINPPEPSLMIRPNVSCSL